MPYSIDDLPPALEPLRTYLKRASELQRASALVGFAVRTFALQIGMCLRDRLKPSDLQFLMDLMDELEREKAALKISPTGEEQEKATKNLAFDLYARAQAADKPDTVPTASMKWSVMEAPRVAQAYHASAVLIDCLRQFDTTLPPKLESMQVSAQKRSQLLSAQLARAMSTPPPVPPEWRPFPPALLATTKPGAAKPKPEKPKEAKEGEEKQEPKPQPVDLPSAPTAPRKPHSPPKPNSPPSAKPPSSESPPKPPTTTTATTTTTTTTKPDATDPPPTTYTVGQDCWYRDEYGRWQPSRINSAHFDDPAAPYYSIIHPLYAGTTRETEPSRLAPRYPGVQPPNTVLQPPPPQQPNTTTDNKAAPAEASNAPSSATTPAAAATATATAAKPASPPRSLFPTAYKPPPAPAPAPAPAPPPPPQQQPSPAGGGGGGAGLAASLTAPYVPPSQPNAILAGGVPPLHGTTPYPTMPPPQQQPPTARPQPPAKQPTPHRQPS